MLNKLKEKYRNEGYEEGLKQGEEIGFSKGLQFAQEYYEGNKKEEIHKPTKLDDFRNLDSFMCWAKAVFEIADSDYFRSYLFESKTSEDIERFISYLDYLYRTDTIHQFYPLSSINIPELILSLEDVYSNKLVLKQVEEAIK